MTAPVAGRQRQTRQGTAVDGVLDGQERFLSAQEVFELLKAAGQRVGLTTVYRHLGALAGQGLADVVVRADGESTYRVCTPDTHHHHLVCRVCGRTVEVANPALERWAERVAAEHGYRDLTHTVEIFGTCGEHGGSSA